MTHVINGQCGLCTHFDEHSKLIRPETLIQIRKSHEADEEVLAECGHPNNEKLHLKVSPVSGCDGFEWAKEANSQASM